MAQTTKIRYSTKTKWVVSRLKFKSIPGPGSELFQNCSSPFLLSWSLLGFLLFFLSSASVSFCFFPTHCCTYCYEHVDNTGIMHVCMYVMYVYMYVCIVLSKRSRERFKFMVGHVGMLFKETLTWRTWAIFNDVYDMFTYMWCEYTRLSAVYKLTMCIRRHCPQDQKALGHCIYWAGSHGKRPISCVLLSWKSWQKADQLRPRAIWLKGFGWIMQKRLKSHGFAHN